MTPKKIYPVTPNFSNRSHLNKQKYQELYHNSITMPEDFWSKQAKQFITWFSPWETVASGSFDTLDMRWFIGGKLNACYNCLDRHLPTRSNQTAIIWESDDPNYTQKITYAELHEKVCRFANVLKTLNVGKGDRVCIYMPMIPEIIIAILACARIGAVHSVVFAGFSANALKTRIIDLNCAVIITADEGVRGGKYIPLKINTDAAVTECSNIKKVIVVKRTGNAIPWINNRDIWYHEIMEKVDSVCSAEPMDANDPLFVLYTSGSTGKPKGILHTLGGYLVYVAMSFHYIFDYHDQDVYWCTADLGWITGHSYLLYGPLTNGATTVIFEGVPSYPNYSRYWEIVDRYQVNIFYTAPTAIRTLRHEGDEWVKKTSRKSLKILGTVGEPINPDVWEWYFQVVGDNRCAIVDTWWQTETGGILMSPLPGVTPMKPGSVAWPFFGIVPEIIDDQGQSVKDNQVGKLIIKNPWPGLMKSVFKDHKRFVETYFGAFPGKYLTGDGAYRDSDGYYWIVGREDDVIKVSGHRIGTGEVESALICVAEVSEAAVVSVPDEIKGEAIFAYVVLKKGINLNEELKHELNNQVRKNIGPIITLKEIHSVSDLPKTRSGKIMRRILKKIACDEFDDLGDISTLTDPNVVDALIAAKKTNKE